jgi:simple sugar transport system substrate-binding protein
MTIFRRLPFFLVLAVVALALAFVAVGCGDDDDDEGDQPAQTGGGTETDVDLSQGKDITIAMVTHGDGGSFWSVAKKGAEDAAKDLGIELKYSESNNDPQRQAQMIEAAVSEKVDGLAVSAPNPDAIAGALKKASDAGIPIVTLNSGADVFQDLGAITHVGQTETVAGQGAGAEFKEAGGQKMICIIHEQANIGLNQRCDGAKRSFGGDVENLQVKGTEDIPTTQTEIKSKLQSEKDIDSVLSLNPDIAVAAQTAIREAGSDAKLATFDLSGDVIKAISDGDILFAIDQQQYTQGYLPLVFLMLNKTNANTIGGGKPVLTGPGFVTQDNADQIAELAEAGTR